MSIITTTTITTSSYGGAAYLPLTNCSSTLIKFNLEESISTPIRIKNVHDVIFDGLGNSFSCTGNFFEIGDDCYNIEIRNFNVTAVGAPAYGNSNNALFFLKMVTDLHNISEFESATPRYNILVHDNNLSLFNVAISLGADHGPKIVNSSVYDNYIYGTVGTEAGFGYGIHLANAYSCSISNNFIKQSTRHAIYNAWGNSNTITGNTLREHWKGVGLPPNQVDYDNQPSREIGKVRAALAIYRSSSGITVSGNIFEDTYNVSISLNTIPDGYVWDNPPSDYDPRPYGMMSYIIITGNTFTHTGAYYPNDTNSNNKNPAISIGSVMDSSHTYTGYLINYVTIQANDFTATNADFVSFCQVFQCNTLTIKDNSITFSSYPFTSDVIHLLIAFNNGNVGILTMNVTATNNVFTTTNTSPQAHVVISAFSDVSNHFNTGTQMTITGNTLANQIIGGVQMFQLYYGFNATAYGTLPSGFNLQLES